MNKLLIDFNHGWRLLLLLLLPLLLLSSSSSSSSSWTFQVSLAKTDGRMDRRMVGGGGRESKKVKEDEDAVSGDNSTD